jgi:hypothetical protein
LIVSGLALPKFLVEIEVMARSDPTLIDHGPLQAG